MGATLANLRYTVYCILLMYYAHSAPFFSSKKFEQVSFGSDSCEPGVRDPVYSRYIFVGCPVPESPHHKGTSNSTSGMYENP